MAQRRSSTTLRLAAVAIFGVALLLLLFAASRLRSSTAVSGPISPPALLLREQRVAAREALVEAVMKAMQDKTQRQATGGGAAQDLAADSPDATAPQRRFWASCPTAPRPFIAAQPASKPGGVPCGGRGACNATSLTCACQAGWAGYACDVDLAAGLGSAAAVDGFHRRRRRLADALAAPSKSGPLEPSANQLLDAGGVAALVAVVVPYLSGTGGLLPLKQLILSILAGYPGVAVVAAVAKAAMVAAVETLLNGPRESGGPRVATVVDASADKWGGLGSAWNAAVAHLATRHREPSAKATAAQKPPLLLLLASDVVAFHAHTNLELAVSQLLTTDADVLGFNTLAPVTDAIAAAASGTLRKNGGASSSAKEFLFISECWTLRHRQWAMRFHTSPFGYRRHQEFVAYCDRTSNSFLVRASFQPRFDPVMKELAVADFFATIAAQNARLVRQRREQQQQQQHGDRVLFPETRVPGYILVGTCSECLLIATVSAGDPAVVAASSPPAGPDAGAPGADTLVFGQYLLPGPMEEQLHASFAEKWQVELYVPPTGRMQRNPHPTLFLPQATAAAGGEGPDARLTGPGHGRLLCVKSGGIYGHSQRGLFAPLCHRLERQRDFAFLSALWMDVKGPALRGATAGGGGKSSSSRRYGVSLHHGNLFGALRMGQELLWETDGDIDFIAFDDTHDEMMRRWEAFLQQAQAHGFELKVTYPDKPWYVSLLRDKTDFQVNCRGVLSPQTRGKPPQVHNVTVWYQGVRCFVNGFQNPWQSIRSDPGHDYRGQYLAQQGWVLNFAKQSIGCLLPPQNSSSSSSSTEGAFAHNACLPSCNDPLMVADHHFCSLDEGHDFADWRDLQPIQLL